MRKTAVTREWLEGYIAGLTAFAWWKDGVEYVGTCGTTLKRAIEDAAKEFVITEEIAR